VKIVLIDDEQRLLDALVTTFRFRWPEADILTATDGETGLWLALEHSPDLVILDVGLPDRSGFDVLADIRRTSDVPVIVLTAAKDETDHVRGLELGADDYLNKPFGNMALLAHIKAVLRRAQPLAEPSSRAQLVVGRLRVDEPRREVIGPGGRVRLTPIEFRLFYYLMRNTGHMVSRSALIRRVWGSEEGATDHDLSVFIARLRAKLALAGDPQAIVTEPGLGYRVVPS
jgi:two-component system, OmpR family, response regulator VicR